ncbi:HAD family hydrolase [Flavobacterium sp. DG1-102-2]|uniref:HAD family hydrolase n=1 Tax=Flavobacterium sp. DG1-102-2 TaxID=3081663 RepID=UPI00294A10EA|nr:HAD family hydrolase [Flavobacterium sp. DG1-102-2]MDV6166859.1 HAD family hydrolase [Flavobacterium sp. DG1-102-2]
MKNIKAVIFDLDGTLANTLPLCISAFRKSIEPLISREVSDEEIIATFGPSEEGTIMALAPNDYDKGVADYLSHYETLHEMCPAPFGGVIELLELLKNKGIPTAMVTGKGRNSAVMSLERFGISKYFEVLETGIPEGPSKPKGIQAVLNTFTGVANEEVIYVGDAPSDITACRQVGVPIIAAAWAETAEPEKLIAMHPDELFYDVPSFAKWLEAKI